MKRLGSLALAVSAVVSTLAFMSSSASAIPVFARKYNTQCNMCHTVPPRLNKFGVAFKQNGFELPAGTVLPESETWGNQVLSNDIPKAIVGAGFPVMLRTGLHTEISGNTQFGGATAVSNAPLGIILGEFGMIGGGSLETPFGGLGYWIDAPGAMIGAFELDMNFNPLFKVTAANAIAPQVGYGLGLPIMAYGANTIGLNNVNMAGAAPIPPFAPITVDRNEAATTTNGLFTWGNNSMPGFEVRGTTDPSTGLGINYSAGYLTQLVGTAKAAATVGGQDASAWYLSGSYFFKMLNTNLTVGYSNEKLQVLGAAAPGPATPLPPDLTQTLVSAAWNVGENLQATLTYNQFGGLNAGVFSGVMGPNAIALGAPGLPVAPAAGAAIVGDGYSSVITFAPEWMITPQIYVGGRYSKATGAKAGTNKAAATTPDATVMSIGVGYKILQNVQAYINYTTKDDGSNGALNNGGAGAQGGNVNKGSSIVAGVDFVI